MAAQKRNPGAGKASGASGNDHAAKLICSEDNHCNSATQDKPIRRLHGMRYTPEWEAWKGAKQRCSNPNNPAYARYGGRGISVCRRWTHGENGVSGFELFMQDMGPRPSSDFSLDREDSNGNYEPANCRWATKLEQSRNRGVVKLDPEKVRMIRTSQHPCAVLAKRLQVSIGVVYNARHRLTWQEVRP